MGDALTQAVQHKQGPLIVLAGAGSRKTSTLVQRLVALWCDGVWPFDVLTLVFSRRAAQDVRSRLAEALAKDPSVASRLTAQAIDVSRLPIMTFHAFAWRIIRGHDHADQPARILTPEWSRKLLRGAREKVLGAKPAAGITLQELATQIALARSRGQSPDELAAAAPDSLGLKRLAQTLGEYEALLRKEAAHDFAGLIPEAVRLLETEPSVLGRLHDQHTHVMVDEAQDMSVMQLRLVELLAGLSRNVVLVASPAQAIYEWAGADWQNVDQSLAEAWPETQRLILDTSWRCTPTILQVAARPLDRGRYPDLGAKPQRTETRPVLIYQLADARDEPRTTAQWVQETRTRHGLRYGDIAVLARVGRQLEPVARALETAGVPVDLGGRHALLGHEECRVALSWLSIAVNGDDANPRHVATTLNTPPRGIGRVAQAHLRGANDTLSLPQLRSADLSRLQPAAQEGVARYLAVVDALREAFLAGTMPTDLIETALRISGYYAHVSELESDVEVEVNITGLKEQAADYTSVAEFLGAIDKRLLAQGLTAPGEGVTLATISATKGLEYAGVLILGAEVGLLPHAMATTDRQLEAERRLWYVACTRARDHLAILTCRRRDGRDTLPSPFLPPPDDDVVWDVEGIYA